MTRFTVLVVDDEPLARAMVATLLREDAEVEAVLECADAASAAEVIRTRRPDILFLDIEMPEATGLDLARTAGEDGPVIVFVTAFNSYATTAFEVGASDYVLKPFSDRRFHDALDRAKRRVRERQIGALAQQLAVLSAEVHGADQPAVAARGNYLERLSFKHQDRTIVLKTAEVAWIEAEDYYVRIHSDRGRYLVRTPLATLEARLNPREFLRVHRGAIVNLQHVVELRDAGGVMVILDDGSEVPVSRSRRATVEAAALQRTQTRRS